MRRTRPTAALRCKRGGACGQSGAQHCGCGRRACPRGGRTRVAACLGELRKIGGALFPPRAHARLFLESLPFILCWGITVFPVCREMPAFRRTGSNAGIPPPKGRHARHSTPLFLGGDEVVAIWWTWSPMPRRHAIGCHFGPQHAGRLVHVDHVHTRDAVAPRLGSLAGVQSQAALSMDSGANCHSWSASLHVCKAQDKIASMHQVLGLRSHRIRSACPPARSCRHRARSATLGQKPMARRDGKVSHWLRQIRAARLLVTVRLARDAVH